MATAVAKVVSGYRPHYMLSEASFYGVALAEVAAAGLLFTRHRRTVAAFVALLCGVMFVVVGWGRLDGVCGCVGVFELSRSAHLVALCALGTIAALVGLASDLSMVARRWRAA
jgi:hypothetical protein